MKSLRTLLAIGSLLLLSTSTVSAQRGKVACKDGSKSAGGRGACSGHGGVMTAEMKAQMKTDAKAARAEKKMDKKAAIAEKKADQKAAVVEKKDDKKVEKAEKRTAMGRSDDHDARGATAECKDHTYSHAATHQGSCSRHGGVAKFLDAK